MQNMSGILPRKVKNWIQFEEYQYVKKNGVFKVEKDDAKGVVLPFTIADVIHSVLPKSRIIVVVREPVSRYGSHFLF